MKKIAVCISGQLRNISHKSPIFDLLNSIKCDMFVSTWSERGSTSAYDRYLPSSYIAELLLERASSGNFNYDLTLFRSEYPSLYECFYKDEIIDKKEIKKIFTSKLKDLNIEEFPKTFDNDNTLAGVTYPEEFYKYMPIRYKYSLPMYYMIYKADLLRQKYEKEHNFVYDVVIRVRPDISFNDLTEILDIIDNKDLKNNAIYAPDSINKNTFVNDMFAIGNSKVMSIYSSVFTKLNDYWDLSKYQEFTSRSAEFLLKFHLQLNRIDVLHMKHGVFIENQSIKKSWSDVYQALKKDLDFTNLTPKQSRLFSIVHYYYHREKKDAFSFEEKQLLIKDLSRESKEYATPIFSWTLAYFYSLIERTDAAIIEYHKSYDFLKAYEPNISIELAKILYKKGNIDQAIDILIFSSLKFEKEYFVLRELGNFYLQKYELTENILFLNLSIAYLEKSSILSKYKNKICNSLLTKAYKIARDNQEFCEYRMKYLSEGNEKL